MRKEFINYNQALKLKELGFDEPCLFAFDNCSTPMRCSDLRTNDQKFNGVNYNSSTYTSQPTFSQAFRWFREKYDCHHTIQHNKKYVGIAYSSVVNFSIDEFDTYEEAELACLDKLIELTFKSE